MWFADDAPVDELRRIPGVDVDEVRGSEVRGVFEGAPDALLAVLARHRVAHLLVPEPDLEDAFLRFYESDDPNGTDEPTVADPAERST